MSTAITPDPEFRPAAREFLDVARPFVSVWLDADTFVQVPLTPEGVEYLHSVADACRWATVPGQAPAEAAARRCTT